jgi:hypothetical protein
MMINLLPQVDLQWVINHSVYIGFGVTAVAAAALILIAWWEDLNS